MKKIILKIFPVLLFLLLAEINAYAQDNSEDLDYTTEFIWGINKNTNGGLIGGLVFKYSRALGRNYFHNFGVEIMNVKHPKEQRQQSQYGNFYILGKQNYLYSLRLQYGRELILFKKAPQQGVQISANIAAGPTVGIVAPYYIQYRFQDQVVITEQYQPEIHTDNNYIMGTGRLFQGIGKSKIQPGANLKSSLSFEWGTFKTNVMGLEAGFVLEAFPNEIVLMPMAENRKFFSSAFVTLFYGSRK